MIGVGAGRAGNSPSLIPFKVVIVDKDAHKFGNAKCRVSVVNVDSNFFIKFADIHPGFNVMANDRLDACGNEEVFLN